MMAARGNGRTEVDYNILSLETTAGGSEDSELGDDMFRMKREFSSTRSW
jgi:hypothetical protein